MVILMVFGFGEGSITLTLDKTNLAFGETVHGKLSLKLKKEKQARQLRVRLEAVQTQRRYGPVLVGPQQRSSSRTDVLFSTDTIVDGEKLYTPPGKDYEFKIQVPAKSALPAQPQGGLATAMKTMQFLSGIQSQLRWYVTASLDIPGGKDISKRIQVSVQ